MVKYCAMLREYTVSDASIFDFTDKTKANTEQTFSNENR